MQQCIHTLGRKMPFLPHDHDLQTWSWKSQPRTSKDKNDGSQLLEVLLGVAQCINMQKSVSLESLEIHRHRFNCMWSVSPNDQTSRCPQTQYHQVVHNPNQSARVAMDRIAPHPSNKLSKHIQPRSWRNFCTQPTQSLGCKPNPPGALTSGLTWAEQLQEKKCKKSQNLCELLPYIYIYINIELYRMYSNVA